LGPIFHNRWHAHDKASMLYVYGSSPIRVDP